MTTDEDIIRLIEEELFPVWGSVHPMQRDAFRRIIRDLCTHFGRPDLGEKIFDLM